MICCVTEVCNYRSKPGHRFGQITGRESAFLGAHAGSGAVNIMLSKMLHNLAGYLGAVDDLAGAAASRPTTRATKRRGHCAYTRGCDHTRA